MKSSVGGYAEIKSYTSALPVAPKGKWRGGTIKIARHDIMDKIPKEFREAKAIYCEPAWPSGLPRFDQLAETTENQKWHEYSNRVVEILEDLSIPYFLNWTSMASRRINRVGINVKLSKANTVLYTNIKGIVSEGMSEYEIMKEVFLRYDNVLDFCCGLGRTGVAAKRLGKRAILSDYNGRYITHCFRVLLPPRKARNNDHFGHD